MDKIQEIMGLVQEYADYERLVVKMEIESALRELVGRKDLHSEIMNISVDKACIDELGINERLAYKRGHKDARHAAAEIVAAIGD